MWRAGFTDTCVASVLALVSSSQSWNPPYFGEFSTPRLPMAYGFGRPSSRDVVVDVDQLALGVGDGVLSFACTPGRSPWYKYFHYGRFQDIRWRLACKGPENLTVNCHCVHPPPYCPRPLFSLPLPPLSPPLMKLDSHKRVRFESSRLGRFENCFISSAQKEIIIKDSWRVLPTLIIFWKGPW